MKWIRTECGIVIGKRLFDEEYIIVDNILYFDDYKEKYKIKKQGDNLIDVLEKFDILVHKKMKKPEIYRGITEDYNHIVCNQLDRFIPIEKLFEYNVLTKEQYMKSVQTV